MACCATSLSPDVTVLKALLALPNRKELQVDSPRTQCIKNLVEKLLTILHNEDSDLQATFKEFSKELLTTLKSIMETLQPSKLRENMWIQYARVRTYTLPPLWKRFLLTINCERVL